MSAESREPRSPAGNRSRRRILFTGTSYPSSSEDWKGLFLQRLVEALAQRDDIALSVWLPPGPLPAPVHSVWHGDDAAWLRRMTDRGGIAHLLRRHPLRGGIASAGLLRRLRRVYRNREPQLFHVNWLQNALSLPNDGRPALVTALGTDMQLLRIPAMKYLLRRSLRNRRTVLCPNADWMVPVLQDAFGDVAHVRCIPFGISTGWYETVREPAIDVHRWLCVTRLTAAKLGPLFEWGEAFFAGAPGRELHLFGPRQEDGIAIPEWVRFHGPATPDQLLHDWFPTATGLISLSRHAEGRPQVMLEAMAAGVPILASRLPAHEDIVQHASTGWLCDDRRGMTDGFAMIEDMQRNATMGACARVWAREHVGTWADCAARYAALYSELLDE